MVPQILRQKLEASAFKKLTPTERDWCLYDAMWSIEDRVCALERRDNITLALIAGGSTILTTVLLVGGSILVGLI